MSDTLFADVSYFQPVVNNAYPYGFFCFRANDGTFQDPHFYQNLAWAKGAVKSGKLTGFLVYVVFETNWQDTLATLKAMVGTPDPAMAVMIDVESWGGKISGNHSSDLNAMREGVISWLNSYRPASVRRLYLARDRKRVMAYANQGDRQNIWPAYRDAKWTIANYGFNPHLGDQIAHQFSDHFAIAPFGYADCNSADGYVPKEFAKKVGLAGKSPVKPKPPKFPLTVGKRYGMTHYNGKQSAKHRAEIKMLQRKLVKHGYAGKVNADKWCDGYYGPATANAVNKLKKKWKFRQNGMIGPIAWRRIVRM